MGDVARRGLTVAFAVAVVGCAGVSGVDDFTFASEPADDTDDPSDSDSSSVSTSTGSLPGTETSGGAGGNRGDGHIESGGAPDSDTPEGGSGGRVASSVLYVSNAGNDLNDGFNANFPKLTLTDALAHATSGMEVHVAMGTYEEAILLRGGVSLYGGYDLSFAHRDIAKNRTLITTHLASATVDRGYEDGMVVFDGFHVENMTYNESTRAIYGGFGAFTISRNTIHGGYGFDTSAAIWSTNGLVMISNNVIHSGRGKGVMGMLISGGGQVTNNTIAVMPSSDGASEALGIYVGAGHPVITNNVIFMISPLPGLGTCWGITESGTDGDPASFQDNLIFGFNGAYASDAGAIVDAAGIDALNAEPITDLPLYCNPGANECQTSRYQGTIGTSLTPSDIFEDFEGPDGNPDMLGDNDWRIRDTNFPQLIDIRTGGKDANGFDCGSYEASASCGGVVDDRHGLARTMPYSMGAHENDVDAL